jgi:prepilin-type N-terminal cleavage/methylation domain-containing protein
VTISELIAHGARRLRARLAVEPGFTIIEVVVAVLILALVTAAATTLFVDGSDTSVTAQRESQLISVVDQQMAKIRQEVKTQGFNLLAMNGNPVALPSGGANTSYSTTLEADPNYFVSHNGTCGASGYGYAIEANYNNTAEDYPVVPGTSTAGLLPWSGCTNSSSQIAEPLEMLTSGFIAPQQTVTVGTGTATVDTYVTDTYVGCNSGGYGGCPTTTGNIVGCSQTPSSNWPTNTASTACGDARRVVIAAVLNNNGNNATGPNAPIYVSTIFTNPTPSNEPTSTLGLTLGLNLG